MNKRLLVAALAILVLTSINATRTNAQSCPNVEAFGVQPTRPVDKTLQSRIEVTYFNTQDANAFVSEANGMALSASYTRLSTDQFVAKIRNLVGDGVANIRKQQSAAPFLGQTAELNLERASANTNAKIIKAVWAANDPEFLAGLDRETEITVSKGSSLDGGYYRLNILSWFVDVSARGGHKTVDYDASILLMPGETAVFKLMGDDEAKRTGAARSYIAVTMRSVGGATLATLDAKRSELASR